MITIIDYGVGNLRSVEKAFHSLGLAAEVTGDPEKVRKAAKIVLPGVGAFGKAMENLSKAGMVAVVKEVIRAGKPFLGICLGFQLLFEASAEVFDQAETMVPGLGIFPGQVLRFEGAKLKIPQIGWNQVQVVKENPFLAGITSGSYCYFVHSYYVKPQVPELVACTTQYGIDYCSGIVRDNVGAFQFHPEKSSQVGLQILKNFGELK